jgi:hypothetical protein
MDTSMNYLNTIDYQPIVDTLIKLGDQLNKPAYRFLKGEVIALSLEKATNGRLQYVDKEGYDNIDLVTGIKYELKSTFKMFSAHDEIIGRVSISNTNKSKLSQTFDYLLCIQTDPTKFAISQLTWDECNKNCTVNDGQVNLNKKVPVTDWICKGNTQFNDLPLTDIDVRKLLASII